MIYASAKVVNYLTNSTAGVKCYCHSCITPLTILGRAKRTEQVTWAIGLLTLLKRSTAQSVQDISDNRVVCSHQT